LPCGGWFRDISFYWSAKARRKWIVPSPVVAYFLLLSSFTLLGLLQMGVIGQLDSVGSAKNVQPIWQVNLESQESPFMFRRRRLMAANDTGDWRELFDVALFEPNRVKLRQRIEGAKDAINTRIDALMKDQNENGSGISEYIALRDALTTLADLHKIAYARKPSASISGQGRRGIAVERGAQGLRKARICSPMAGSWRARPDRPLWLLVRT
jgi:hypothetical protein